MQFLVLDEDEESPLGADLHAAVGRGRAHSSSPRQSGKVRACVRACADCCVAWQNAIAGVEMALIPSHGGNNGSSGNGAAAE